MSLSTLITENHVRCIEQFWDSTKTSKYSTELFGCACVYACRCMWLFILRRISFVFVFVCSRTKTRYVKKYLIKCRCENIYIFFVFPLCIKMYETQTIIFFLVECKTIQIIQNQDGGCCNGFENVSITFVWHKLCITFWLNSNLLLYKYCICS